jgi:hypothetical protein
MSWLRGLFPVRPEERGIVSLLYVLLAITVVANWAGKVGSNSIFIKNVGVASPRSSCSSRRRSSSRSSAGCAGATCSSGTSAS